MEQFCGYYRGGNRLIVKEFYRTRNDGINLYRTYSDEGFFILQNETNTPYDVAIDVENAPYTYSETDKPIEELIEIESEVI